MEEKYAKKLMELNREGYEVIAEHFSKTRIIPWPEVSSFLDKNIKGKVLDLGCGNGRFYDSFKKEINYTGVDNCKKLIEEAKKRHPESKFLKADAFFLPFPDESFDTVFSIAVFHHIPSKKMRKKFLKEAKRVLKKEGKLILTVWKPKNKKLILSLLKFTLLKILFLSRLDFGDVLLPWKDSTGENKFDRYYHFFSEREIKKLFKETNLKVRESGVLKNERETRNNLYFILQKG